MVMCSNEGLEEVRALSWELLDGMKLLGSGVNVGVDLVLIG